ncbi:MAG: cbb3-type cytochrome c oxidase subunit II [Parachlamydiaceae bacterium]
MTTPQPSQIPPPNHHGFVHNLDKSAIFTVIGIILLFSTAVCVTLLAPRYVDPTWTTPSSSYQVQMYEVSDPNLYISTAASKSQTLQAIYHIKEDYSLLAFHESDTLKIVAPENLKKFVTSHNEKVLKLTSELLLLRRPQKTDSFDAAAAAGKLIADLQAEWEKNHPDWKEKKSVKPNFDVLEIFSPGGHEAFAAAQSEGTIENWVDHEYKILDATLKHPYHESPGVIYINNPQEYRIIRHVFNNSEEWHYDPNGEPIKSFEQLTKNAVGFRSRAELIALGEHIYAIEGCWYCHTDQTRTLVQDVVLNGSDSYPAPPSSANEYIYQKITFPGTRRIGPDISRVGIKRPSRDWHKGHFSSPKTASQGSIMPSFRHFFDEDPRGSSTNTAGIPNYQFEAIYQYLMTKGTRITPPTQAWWLGKDPIRTKEIIEGEYTLPK